MKQSITPKKESLHTVLHVLDNQYVPYNIYKNMRNNSLSNLSENEVLYNQYMRNSDAEFKKALLFSKRIFINRAYFINTPLLTKYILDDKQQEAFLELLHRGVICPILLNEDHFFDSIKKLPFSRSRKMDEILDVYIRKLNAGAVRELRHSEIFPGASPGEIIPSRFKNALSDCLGDESIMERRCSALLRIVPGIDEKTLRGKIMSVAKWARERSLGEVTRESLYQREICEGGSVVANGKYRIEPEIFALKLWIDAIYNDNAAKLYDLKITMPQYAPTSQELGVFWKKTGDADVPLDIGPEVARARSNVPSEIISGVAHFLTTDHSPQVSYQNLTLRDILFIRETEEWKKFIYHLEKYVDFDENEDAFILSLHAFFSRVKECGRENHDVLFDRYLPAPTTVITAGKYSIILMGILGNTFLAVNGNGIYTHIGVTVLEEALRSMPEKPSVNKRITRGIAFVRNRRNRIYIENRFGIDYSTRILSGEELESIRQSLHDIRKEDCGIVNPIECTSME